MKTGSTSSQSRKVAVTGGRYFYNTTVVYNVLNYVKPAYLVVGDATGLDKLARLWAEFTNTPYIVYPADWAKYGRRAGPIRNRQMLEEQMPDFLVAFPGGAGTRNCIWQAKQLNIPVRMVKLTEKVMFEK